MSGGRGFALLAVLWVVTALAALAAAGMLGVRVGAAATRNRLALTRARWAAEGCLAVAQARLDSVARRAAPLALPPLDTVRFANGASCTVTAFDPGARLNPDSASREMRARFDSALADLGLTGARDSMITRDGDGRINLNAAPASVLAALPGFGAEVVRAVTERRALGDRFTELFQVAARLSPAAREELLARYAELVPRVTFAPTALVVTATGWVPGEHPLATVEVIEVPAGSRAAVVRRRMW